MKNIIVITDGENFEDDATSAANEAQKNGIAVNVVGIGSVNGAPVVDANGQVLTDESGNPAISKLNEQGAMEIAKSGKGQYVNGASNSAVDDLQEQLMKLSKADLENVTYSQESELFPVFAWIAFMLIIGELFIINRKNPWLKRYNFFTKKTQKK